MVHSVYARARRLYYVSDILGLDDESTIQMISEDLVCNDKEMRRGAATLLVDRNH